jgi:hypothetical protein
MSEMHTLSVDIGAYTGATIHPLVYIPATYGDITILDVQIVGIGAGTAIGLILTKATDVGTPVVSGTIATFLGTVVYAEGVVFEATVGTPIVDTGCWLCVDQASGTAPATTLLSINYVFGR